MVVCYSSCNWDTLIFFNIAPLITQYYVTYLFGFCLSITPHFTNKLDEDRNFILYIVLSHVYNSAICTVGTHEWMNEQWRMPQNVFTTSYGHYNMNSFQKPLHLKLSYQKGPNCQDGTTN